MTHLLLVLSVVISLLLVTSVLVGVVVIGAVPLRYSDNNYNNTQPLSQNTPKSGSCYFRRMR